MKRILLAACLILFIASPSLAQGSFSFEDLLPILNQRPELAQYLLSTLDFAPGGFASRIEQSVNERLGGRRLGPYRILAKPKGAEGDYVFEVIVYTERHYLDEVGNPIELRLASSVVEKLKHVEIRAVEDLEPSRRPTRG